MKKITLYFLKKREKKLKGELEALQGVKVGMNKLFVKDTRNVNLKKMDWLWRSLCKVRAKVRKLESLMR